MMITTNSVVAERGDANPASNLDMSPARDGIVLRSMKAEDLPQVVSIEKQSFSPPWSRQSFQAELDTEVSQPMVAVCRGEVVGYIVPWYVADELQIANLAVRPDCRKQGIATALLSGTLESARQQNCTAAYLEVRASNYPALEFYEKMGFQQSGSRREYYHSEPEDAVLMQKPLV